MNINKIVRNAIRSYITESAITEAVNHIMENGLDIEEYLQENSKLIDKVLEEIDSAIDEELENF